MSLNARFSILYNEQCTPWDRISDPASLQALPESAGANQVEVFAEAGSDELATPEDRWTIVMGGGFRGTIDQLDLVTKERIRSVNLEFSNEIHSLDSEVLYAITKKKRDKGMSFCSRI